MLASQMRVRVVIMVYVDDFKGKYRGMVMSHMVADTLPELHKMASDLGLKREWFQPGSGGAYPHYDVSQTKKALAVQYGAIQVSSKYLIGVIQRWRGTEEAAVLRAEVAGE